MKRTKDAYCSYSQTPQELSHTFRNEYNGNWCGWEAQEEFYSNVIQNPLVLKYPIPIAHTTRVLKQIIEDVEHAEQGNEDGVIDALLNAYMDAKIKQEQTNVATEISHRIFTYDFDNRPHNIILRVKQRFTNVGLGMWEAGYLLGEFILQNPSLFANKTIVELGSGVGLSGLCLRHVHPRKVYLTDYMDQVMQNCQENMEINGMDSEYIHSGTSDANTVIQHLDWNAETIPDFNADVLIGADIAYDISAIPAMVYMTNKIMEQTPGLVAYYAITYRHENTFSVFEKECEKYALVISPIPKPSPMFQYQNRTDENVFMYTVQKSL